MKWNGIELAVNKIVIHFIMSACKINCMNNVDESDTIKTRRNGIEKRTHCVVQKSTLHTQSFQICICVCVFSVFTTYMGCGCNFSENWFAYMSMDNNFC